METFVYFVLLLLGIFFIRNGLTSLKKLEENNQKWERLLTRKSEFYLANFLEAQELIKKLKRYISFLARFELLNGTLVILFMLLTMFGNITGSDFSGIGTLSEILFFIAILLYGNCQTSINNVILPELFGVSDTVEMSLSHRFELVIDFLKNNHKDDNYKISDFFNDYIDEHPRKYSSPEINYKNNILFRCLIFTCLYFSFLLFIISFYFDFSFRKMVVDFVSIPFV